jgi:dTDP-4-dehydrorhamnose 3,5-epimerase
MGSMHVTQTSLHGVYEFEPRAIQDARGYNMRVFADDVHAKGGVDHAALVQENQVYSRYGVVRGLHARRNLTEGKLVSCVRGEIWDVAVDVRPWSPTFLRWQGFVLDDRTWKQVFLPPGILHGHQILSQEGALLRYRVDERYDPSWDVAVRWDDPDLAIPWPIQPPIVSQRDRDALSLSEAREHFEAWYGTLPPTPAEGSAQ